MKILHLIDSGGLYGAEKMLLSLVQEQVNQGLEPMILSAGELGISEKPIEVEARKRQLPVICWRMKPGLNLRESRRIVQWAENNRYQVLHSHGYKFNILMGLHRLIGLRTPLICTLHGYVNAPRFSKLWIYEKTDGIFLRFADNVCLVASHMRNLSVVRKLSVDRVRVIENGLPELESGDEEALLEPELRQFLENNTFNLLAVGRLSPEKNFSALLRVLASERLKKKGLGLCIVGEGSKQAELEQLRRELGLHDRVRLLGYRGDVSGLMKKFDLLVMPSLTEGLPITLLEAMCMRLPVLATKVGGIPEALDHGNAGILVTPNSDDCLAEGIDNAMNERKVLLDMSESARREFEVRFTVKSMAEKYRNLYSMFPK